MHGKRAGLALEVCQGESHEVTGILSEQTG